MRVMLFTERNSPYGANVMDRIFNHPEVSDLLLVTRDPAVLCDYYIHDETQVSMPDLARAQRFAVIESDDINSPEILGKLGAFSPDLIVLANYQLKIKSNIAGLAKRFAVNFHPSPLPRYAGLAPFFWMARNGETRAGVSCCLVEDKIDSGALVHSVVVPLGGTETAGEIRETLFVASYKQVSTVFDLIAKHALNTQSQCAEERTYYGKPKDSDLTIDWSHATQEVMRTIRAGAPLPGAITSLPNGKQVRIREAQAVQSPLNAIPGTVTYQQGLPVIQTGDGAVRIISYTSYCPPTLERLAATPLHFDLTSPPPKHSGLALLAAGTPA